MTTTRTLVASTFLILLSACSAECSCGSNSDDDDGDGGSGGSTSSVTGTGGDATGTGGSGGETGSGGGTTTGTGGGGTGGGGTGGGGTGGGGTGGGGDVAGYCALACEVPADCCPEGVPDCPGAFPNNWECNDGICSNPGCSENDECTFGGALPEWECFPTTFGDTQYGLCAEACSVDEDCSTPDFLCIGEADGRTYCAPEPVEPTPCESDDDCAGFGVCQEDGSCSCSGNEECTVEGYVCVE